MAAIAVAILAGFALGAANGLDQALQRRCERQGWAHLADDVAQRSELLSAREREVLENHLQAEIAAEIQRLMRAAVPRIAAARLEPAFSSALKGVLFTDPAFRDKAALKKLDLLVRKYL